MMGIEAEQILFGSLLGDGCIVNSKGYYIFEEVHSIKQKDYLLWKNKFLKFNYYEYKTVQIHKCNKIFKELRSLFYPNGKKIVSSEILSKIEPLGLAVWYMDDGSYNYSNHSAFIYTYCFGLEGNQIIKNWFKDRWKLNCNIRKSCYGYHLRLNAKVARKFFNLIKEFILPTMQYKIGLDIQRYNDSLNSRKKYYQKNCYELKTKARSRARNYRKNKRS